MKRANGPRIYIGGIPYACTYKQCYYVRNEYLRLDDIYKEAEDCPTTTIEIIGIIQSILDLHGKATKIDSVLNAILRFKDNHGRDVCVGDLFKSITRIADIDNSRGLDLNYLKNAALHLAVRIKKEEDVLSYKITKDLLHASAFSYYKKEFKATINPIKVYNGTEITDIGKKETINIKVEGSVSMRQQLIIWQEKVGRLKTNQLSWYAQRLIDKNKIKEKAKAFLVKYENEYIGDALHYLKEDVFDKKLYAGGYNVIVYELAVYTLISIFDKDIAYATHNPKVYKSKRSKQKKERDIKNTLWTILGYILAVPLWVGVIAFALAMIYMLILLPAWTDGLFNMKAEYVWYNPITWGECWWENLCRLEWLNLAIIPLSYFYSNIVCEEIKAKGKTKERIILSIILYIIIIWYFPVIMDILIAILAFIATALSGFGLLMEIVNENYY